MQYKTEVARVSRSLWGLKTDAQTIIYKGEEIDEITMLNRVTEDEWKLIAVIALPTDVLGGTSEIVLRYYFTKN